MTNQHPITPPFELVKQWRNEGYILHSPGTISMYVATRAAQWGADQELEACSEWVAVDSIAAATELRAWRRPKPPSLKEEALAALHGIDDQGPTPEQIRAIRRALEKLDD